MGKIKKSNCSYLLINGKHVHDNEELVNHFNEHFSTIAQNLLNKLPNRTTRFIDYLSDANRQKWSRRHKARGQGQGHKKIRG